MLHWSSRIFSKKGNKENLDYELIQMFITFINKDEQLNHNSNTAPLKTKSLSKHSICGTKQTDAMTERFADTLIQDIYSPSQRYLVVVPKL